MSQLYRTLLCCVTAIMWQFNSKSPWRPSKTETEDHGNVCRESDIRNRELTRKQEIVFAGAQCSTDEIIVIFSMNRQPQRYTWSQYEAIGREATAAVVKARWNCQELQQLAQKFHRREINLKDTETRLMALESTARLKRARRSTWIDDLEKSVFD